MHYKKYEPWLYLAPALVALVLVFGYPIVRLVILSLQRTSGGVVIFAGLTN
jgi:ABC-type sugar transport system permease subunit